MKGVRGRALNLCSLGWVCNVESGSVGVGVGFRLNACDVGGDVGTRHVENAVFGAEAMGNNGGVVGVGEGQLALLFVANVDVQLMGRRGGGLTGSKAEKKEKEGETSWWCGRHFKHKSPGGSGMIQ